MKGLDYVMKKEPYPSLCEHWMPDDGLHEMSNTCWCQPILDGHNGMPGVAPKTTVRHRMTQKGIA